MGETNAFTSPAEQAAAEAMLASARALMDEYALELFDLWIGGKAPPEVIIDNKRWAAYMAADQRLSDQIDRHLIRYAQKYRDDVLSKPTCSGFSVNVSNQPYETSFHAEVGTTIGGLRTGYNVLHGSNRDAGDFQLKGFLVTTPGARDTVIFSFINNKMTFNDKVDPNYKYSADASLETLAKNIKTALKGTPPRDFIVRIIWREMGPWRYEIPSRPIKTGSPDWLRTFNNR
jgi:hypothetical protein